ncbi:MAG TPA: hypothetical protein VJZ27_09970, partial [Aggregatilineales bacterium]|nr:hypothetical protein [Aggregatilineales bacterium]
MKKIAVALIHGMGRQQYSEKSDPVKMARKLHTTFEKRWNKRFPANQINSHDALEVEPIFWAHVIQDAEDKLMEIMRRAGYTGHYFTREWGRRFMIDYLADPMAYQREKTCANEQQPAPPIYYNEVHGVIAEGFNKLAKNAGSDAPLCIIA